MYRKTTTLTLRIVETVEFDDDDVPSLPAQPVYETTGETVHEGPSVTKASAQPARRRSA